MLGLVSVKAASRRRLKASAAKAPYGRRGQDFTVWSKSALWGTPSARHSPVLSLGCTLAASTVGVLARAVQAKAWSVLELQERPKRANIECVVLVRTEVFTFPM